ncbi:MAG: hypothetical protein IJX62_04555 [Clostridia bacterium]|nr:hypothetical protein [Clostridia bacterium]
MKKVWTLFTCTVLLIAMCMSFYSCSSAKTVNPIDFGKKYMQDEDTYYIFYADQTGLFVQRYATAYGSYDYTLSGSVDFVWREASDGAVYLFEVESHYNDDHTQGRELGLLDQPIYFSEDFFTYTNYSQYGASVRTYIKEGSELEKILGK